MTLRSRRSHRSIGHASAMSAARASVTSASPHSPVRSTSTLPRSCAHSQCEIVDPAEEDEPIDELTETRHIVERTEEPGLDSLRGVAGALGTIIRARRRARELSAMSATRSATCSEAGSIHGDNALHTVGSRGSANSAHHHNWFQGLWSTRPSQFKTMSDVESVKEPQPSHSVDAEKGRIERVEVTESEVQDSPDSISVSTEQVPGLPSIQRRTSTSMHPTTAPSLRSVISDGRARASSVVHFEDTRSMSTPLIPSTRNADVKSEEGHTHP